MADEQNTVPAAAQAETTVTAPAVEQTETAQEPQQTAAPGTAKYDTFLSGKAGEGANSSTDAQAQAEPTQNVYNFSDTVKGYDMFEFNQENSDAFVDVIKEMNLSNEQANAILKHGMEWGKNLVGAVQQAAQQELDNMVKGWGDAARAELGASFDSTITKAGAALERLEKTIPTLRQALDETGAGNRIEFIKALAFIEEKLSGDPGMVAGVAGKKPADEFAARYPNTDWGKI